jgi:integrase
MKWKDVDLAASLWHKPTTKTGVPHTVPLPAQLVTRLEALPKSTEWVFPSQPSNNNGFRAGQWSATPIEHAWRRIRKRAGLPDVRLHDLRRTCASWLAINGENLPVIQRTLNHTSLTSTQVYARLSVAPVRRALNEQAERMLAPMAVDRQDSRQEWPG